MVRYILLINSCGNHYHTVTTVSQFGWGIYGIWDPIKILLVVHNYRSSPFIRLWNESFFIIEQFFLKLDGGWWWYASTWIIICLIRDIFKVKFATPFPIFLDLSLLLNEKLFVCVSIVWLIPLDTQKLHQDPRKLLI